MEVGSLKRKVEDNGAHVDVPTEVSVPDGAASTVVPTKKARQRCPYLDTINRHMLDFDFEKLCSVSLSNLNVYACLVCGKYFQGRGKTSHAHYHSLQANHHVFINLQNKKIYCLPDDYEVVDSSLDDIKYLLDPTFTPDQIANLDNNTAYSRCLDGTQYLPGIVGLNNIKCNDYINVVLQALVHIPPLRDFFIVEDNLKHCKSELVHRFGMLVRKMWNPRNSKPQVSPHELLQAIQDASEKRFKIGVQGDPLEFLQWFLNAMHKDLGGTKKPKSSIIYEVFQGDVTVTTETPVKKPESGMKNNQQSPEERTESSLSNQEEYFVDTRTVPFLYLSLDVPPPPLFKDEQERNIIPQIPLFTLLSKFDGQTVHSLVTGERKKYSIKKFPRYLVLHIKRFTKNNWFLEKNPTIVNFPVKNLDMKDHTTMQQSCKYDLLANIKHEGEPNKGVYSVHIQNKGNEQWFEIQDLIVKTGRVIF
jgi:U4/U6.U5 tri-snRNP-associated protein 2